MIFDTKSIVRLQSQTGLVWEDKEETIEKDIAEGKLQFKQVYARALNQAASCQHRIIEGDNLAALHLLVEKKEEFDVIYIDPPYNTGNKDFHYNDHYVDMDDALRHSKWISFMAKRLLYANEILNEKGAIFISIDDYEHARLKLLCDGIFGQKNFVANFIRKNKSGSGHDSKQIAVEFDYVLCYAKDIQQLSFKQKKVNVKKDPKYRYSDDHFKRRGSYYLRDLDYKGSYSSSMDYSIKCPDGSEIFAGKKFGKPNTWRWKQEKFQWGLENDFIVFKQRANGWKVYIKQYQFVDNQDRKRIRKLPHRAFIEFSNAQGSKELKNILPQDIFTYPKPTGLMRFFLQLFENKELRFLDFFAGSGSSLHACMLQNEKDGGIRECTLITNNENSICEKVTYPRNKKVIEGYTTAQGKRVNALENNGLCYFKVKA